jgi:hypothetical protein
MGSPTMGYPRQWPEGAAIMISARERCKRSCTVGRYTLAPAAGTDVARVYSSSA